MQRKRLISAFVAVLVLINTAGTGVYARSFNERPKGYSETDIRLSFPDQSMSDAFRMLKESSDKFLSSKNLPEYLESIKNNPYTYKVIAHDKHGDRVKPGAVKFVNYNGHLVRHLIPALEGQVYIFMDKKVFSEVPMTFLEDHMRENYPQEALNRNVTILWDDFVKSQEVYKKAADFTDKEKDLLAKSIVMGVTYNNKLHEMTEAAFDQFIGKNLNPDNVFKNDSGVTAVELKDKLMPLRNRAIYKINEQMDRIVSELSLLKIIYNFETIEHYHKDQLQTQNELSRENLSIVDRAWREVRGKIYTDFDSPEELKGQIKDRLPRLLKALGDDWSEESLLQRELFDRVKAKPEVWHDARETLLDRITARNIQFNDLTFGRVELTSINRKIVFRMRPHGTEKVFIWTPKQLVKSNSKHFKQYMARQFIEAGSDRTDGQRGRDVVIVYVDEIPANFGEREAQQPLLYNKVKAPDEVEIKNIREFKRPKPAKITEYITNPVKAASKTKKYMGAYWGAKYKTPDKTDVRLGIFCATMQVAVVAGVSYLKAVTDPGFEFSYYSLIVQSAFGGIIGTYASTYQNIVYSTGTRADSEFKVRTLQTMKISANSVLYAALMGLSTDTLNSLSDYRDKGLNIVGNSYGKAEVNQWAVILREKRADTKIIKFRVPFTKKVIDTGVTTGKMNFQFFSQNAILLLRMLDFLKVQVRNMPIGTYIFWGSIPIVKRLTLWWAEKYHPDQAKEMKLRDSWESYIFNPRPDNVARNLMNIARKPYDWYKAVHNRNDLIHHVNNWAEVGKQEFVTTPEGLIPVSLTSSNSCQSFFAPGRFSPAY